MEAHASLLPRHAKDRAQRRQHGQAQARRKRLAGMACRSCVAHLPGSIAREAEVTKHVVKVLVKQLEHTLLASLVNAAPRAPRSKQ